ncbi:TPA: hypothetical protein RTS26_000566 [Staphylococcus aureus]|nr:hypothetical protein [Staphylococcus aureus]
MTHIIIDGDACPVVDSIIDLTTETGIFVTIIRSFSHFSNQLYPPPFTKQDQKVFEQSLLKVIHRIKELD